MMKPKPVSKNNPLHLPVMPSTIQKGAQGGVWQCLICGKTDGVINGMCPTDGAVQTTPVDVDAQLLAQ